jgi:hypothetical protein
VHAVIVAAAGLVLAGCGGSTPEVAQPAPGSAEIETVHVDEQPSGAAPEGAEILGVWRLENGERLFWLGADGRFAIDDRGLLDTAPAAVGTYELAGATIRLENGEGDLCPPGSWELEATLAGDGALETVVGEDVEGRCSVGVGTRWTWLRVSPASPAGAELAAEGLEGEGAGPDAETLPGIWLLEGTGLLLRFAADGAYAFDDEGDLPGAPADAGTFAVDEDEIAFTSGAGTRRCSEGDRWVWRGTRLVTAPSESDAAGVARRGDWALLASPATDDCGRGAGGRRWLRLSP